MKIVEVPSSIPLQMNAFRAEGLNLLDMKSFSNNFIPFVWRFKSQISLDFHFA